MLTTIDLAEQVKGNAVYFTKKIFIERMLNVIVINKELLPFYLWDINKTEIF